MRIKTVLFARVSTREQAEEGYSLQAQEKLIASYAEQRDFHIVKRFSVPESASGKQERKLFNELLAFIYSHPEIKNVICEKVDRITRNFKDAVKLDDWLNENEERQIHFVKQNLVLHKYSRSHERFQWDIYIALARQYSNNLSEETRKGLYEKAAEGWFPGNHKRGYITVGDIGHKVWVIDKTKPDAKYIEMAFVLYDTGNHTLRTLAKELFNQGWILNRKAISKSELHKLLSDPFYCGEFIFNEKLYREAKHPPLVTKELFYRVQERLQRKIKAGKYRKHTFLFGNGLFICGECGRAITGETQKGHNYYHCTRYDASCSQSKYVREEDIQKQVLGILDDFKIDNSRLFAWVKKALQESHSDEREYHVETIEELETKKDGIEKILDQLYVDRCEEKITKDFYERNQAKHEAELNSVLDAIVKHTKANIDYQKLGMNIFELSQLGREIYEKKALMEEKRELLNFVFLNFRLQDKKVVPTLHNGFDVIASRTKNRDLLAVYRKCRTSFD